MDMWLGQSTGKPNSEWNSFILLKSFDSDAIKILFKGGK
jgi:hypothetical protein